MIGKIELRPAAAGRRLSALWALAALGPDAVADRLCNKGDRVPVLIFCTAKVANDKVKNTRCFVFPAGHPDRERDKVKALDLGF